MTQQSHNWAYMLRKTIIQKDTCTPVFIAALLLIARTWKQLKCPSIDEQKQLCFELLERMAALNCDFSCKTIICDWEQSICCWAETPP